MKLRMLGSGTSSGVPRIGGDWGRCDPAEPRNRRRRVSVLVETSATRILVDTTPDLREQLLDAGVSTLDAVIWTHDHADHCHGIDDLRQVFHAIGGPVRGLARTATLDTLKNRFGYVFAGRAGYPATVAAEKLPDRVMVGDIAVAVVDQPHASISSAGLRFEEGGRAIVYATDLNAMTPAMRALYAGADLLVLDALRREPHPSHPDLATALRWIADLAPRRAVLTHLDQSMDYNSLRRELPENVEPGFDGLEVVL